MVKYQLDCAYVISKFKYHNELKNNILSLIDSSSFDHVINSKAEVDITKTDWSISSDFSRKWVQYVSEPLAECMLEIYKELGYDGLTIHELWFQQYQQLAEHGWHTHSGNFTNVYYLEMPNTTPKTQIVNAYNQSDIIELDVNEGDIVVFPSFIIHRAPKNLSNDRKTIISYNTNATYSDNIYGKGLM
jgi:hypothetical protein